jgi:serine acetyltransferase
LLALTAVDLLVIYVIPIAFIAGVFLLSTLTIYALLLSPLDFDFKADIRRRYEDKKALPSGAKLSFSYPYVAGLVLLDNGIQAALLYRVSRYFARRGLHAPAAVFHSFAKFVTHIDVSPYAEIGPGVYFYHGLGTVIGKNTRIGRRATICQNVTTGAGRPEIGDEVALWAGAKVIGDVRIGDHAEVGANAVVTTDVPSDCVAVGVPATRFIPKTPGRPKETAAGAAHLSADAGRPS